jgi:hypothetical protein
MPCRDGTGPKWRKNRTEEKLFENEESCSCQGPRGHHGRRLQGESGCCCETNANLSPADEIEYLERTASQLENELKGIRERIEKLRSAQ